MRSSCGGFNLNLSAVAALVATLSLAACKDDAVVGNGGSGGETTSPRGGTSGSEGGTTSTPGNGGGGGGGTDTLGGSANQGGTTQGLGGDHNQGQGGDHNQGQGGDHNQGQGGDTNGASCTGLLGTDPQSQCLEGACCNELIACVAIQDCVTCLNDPANCANPPQEALDFDGCIASNLGLGGACYEKPDYLCNPVTSGECATGWGCDGITASDGVNTVFAGVACFEHPGTAALCADCGDGPAGCAAGLRCVGIDDTTSKCLAPCCSDADCGGAVGTCLELGETGSGYGVCIDVSGATAVPVCSGIPAPAPSLGSCVNVVGPDLNGAGGGSGTGPADCSALTPAPGCQTCTANSCCGELLDCLDDTDCLGCIGNENNCRTASGLLTRQMLVNCQANTCATDCN